MLSNLQNIKNFLKQKSTYIKPILFILVILCAVLYLGVQYWHKYQVDKAQVLQTQIEQQVRLDTQQAQADLKEQKRDEEIAALKQQLLDLQNKPIETKTITNTITTEAKDTTADIVKKWSPRVAHIDCYWYTTNNNVYAKGSGSVTLVNFTGLGIKAVTSKHILVYNNFLPRECNIELTNGNTYPVTITKNNISIGDNADWAYVSLPTDNILTNITRLNIKSCKNINAGDKILILGYPKIGSKTGLTATEGIMSGDDEDYYITSAKIDQGNSGGAAISIKDDCYLGIPSASVVGQIESLGRILKASFVIEG